MDETLCITKNGPSRANSLELFDQISGPVIILKQKRRFVNRRTQRLQGEENSDGNAKINLVADLTNFGKRSLTTDSTDWHG